MSTSFTLEEANEIAEDFEDLIDTEFSLEKGITLFVDSVAVCPFGESEKEAFMERYAATRNINEAMASYTGDECDVILIVCDVSTENEYSFITIRNFIAQKGIRYNFPE